jgi:hypothetical protein
VLDGRNRGWDAYDSKAVREPEENSEVLTLDLIMSISAPTCEGRSINFRIPADPLSDSESMALLKRAYDVHLDLENAKEPNSKESDE